MRLPRKRFGTTFGPRTIIGMASMLLTDRRGATRVVSTHPTTHFGTRISRPHPNLHHKRVPKTLGIP